MKKALLFLVGLAGAVGVASASNNFSYTATDTPGNSPDGIDQSSNPLQVWTLTTAPGFSGLDGSGGYNGTPGGSSGEFSGWQMYSYVNSPDVAGDGGSATATTTFAGGALAIGQTVSINFEMRALDTGVGTAGLSLLNGSGNAITFEITGGGAYNYTDAGSTAASAGSMGYQYQSPFNIAFTVTGAGTYSAVAGTDAWSGTYSGSLLGMDVFNIKGGNGSDVGFNNLTVVPEPSTWGMLTAGGLMLLGYRRHNALRA
jgi:hypothetical protein